ncbi:leucine-rich repeat domain-containing protein [Prevotella sp. OH937_COT-195]|uniref:leucine-rich repeat domain-containing protein n=1 Tax=Prevotella sp. OH937_COT-195 TaxID=2491051 RepID=UPI000F6544DA|nr:leucine-rich repeat domain-containing protein [Prevotella sp. OH937_COT-195]RRC97308.1 leucine-rich repeat domain-containing protein [Prevotella sp. OH937_COT-195]
MKRKIVLMSLLIMAICSWAQPYPESSYEIEGGNLKKWKGTETEIDFTKDPVLKDIYRILGNAFENNTTLTKVHFSKRMNILKHRAFYNCKNLKGVTFEEGNDWDEPYLEIWPMAFEKCPQLEKIHLPRQYQIPGPNFDGIIWGGLGEMFEECDAVSTVTVSPKHPTLMVYNGAVYNKDRTQLFYVPCATTGDFTVPSSVKQLYNYTFYNSHLSSIYLPADIEEIPIYCFQYAMTLKTIALPRNLRTIKQGAFSSCASLSNLLFPNGLETIELEVFWKCTSLPSVLKLPASLQNVDGSSFGKCDQIKEFSIPNGTAYTAVDGVLFTLDLSTLVLFPGKEGKYEVPVGTIKLGKRSFCRAIINELKLPTTLREIEEGCISTCNKLTELRVAEGVTDIGNYCIHDCENLSFIELPSTLDRIGLWSLVDLNKDKQYKVVCHAPYPPQAKGMLCDTDNKATLYVPQESVELYKITPNWKTFSQILPITDDIIPSKYVLSEDRSTLLRWNGDDKDINFSEYPNLANVTTIAAGAFAGNTSLETLIADNVQKIENGTEDTHGAFEAATSLKEVSLTALTSVGDRAFAKCSALRSVSLSYSVERLGNHAFAYCTAMEEYPYFSSLSHIGDFTFTDNTSLRSFMFSPSLQQIGEQAFANNMALSELTSFAVTPPVLGKKVFLNVPVSKVNLNVPAEAENAYRNAEQWKDFFNNNTGIDSQYENLSSFHIDEKGLSIYGTPQCNYRIYDITGKIIIAGKFGINGKEEISHQKLNGLSSVLILSIQDSKGKAWHNISFSTTQ